MTASADIFYWDICECSHDNAIDVGIDRLTDLALCLVDHLWDGAGHLLDIFVLFNCLFNPDGCVYMEPRRPFAKDFNEGIPIFGKSDEGIGWLGLLYCPEEFGGLLYLLPIVVA